MNPAATHIRLPHYSVTQNPPFLLFGRTVEENLEKSIKNINFAGANKIGV